MTELNTKAIIDISEKNPTAEMFFTYAACRERNVRDGISRLSAIKSQMAKEGFHPVPQDLLSTFRELDRAGVGQLRGDSFKWNMSIKDVGEAVTSPKQAPAPQPKATVSLPYKSTKTLVIVFPDDKQATVEFSGDLTKAEIRCLAEKLLAECR